MVKKVYDAAFVHASLFFDTTAPLGKVQMETAVDLLAMDPMTSSLAQLGLRVMPASHKKVQVD